MKKLITLLFITTCLITSGQPNPIPDGQLIKFRANNVEEELGIFYPIDYELVKQLFTSNEPRPRFIKKKSSLPEHFDTTKSYVLAALTVIFCSDCYFDEEKIEFMVTNWIFIDPESLPPNPKALGKQTSILTGKWVNNLRATTPLYQKSLSLNHASFERTQVKSKVDYKIISDSFSMDITFQKDSALADSDNPGLYQTVRSIDGEYFTVYSSFGQRERKVTNTVIKINTKNPLIKAAENPVFLHTLENWTAVGGTYKK